MILQTEKDKHTYELAMDLVEDMYGKRCLKVGMSSPYSGNTGMYINESSARLMLEELTRFVEKISESPMSLESDQPEEEEKPKSESKLDESIFKLRDSSVEDKKEEKKKASLISPLWKWNTKDELQSKESH